MRQPWQKKIRAHEPRFGIFCGPGADVMQKVAANISAHLSISFHRYFHAAQAAFECADKMIPLFLGLASHIQHLLVIEPSGSPSFPVRLREAMPLLKVSNAVEY